MSRSVFEEDTLYRISFQWAPIPNWHFRGEKLSKPTSCIICPWGAKSQAIKSCAGGISLFPIINDARQRPLRDCAHCINYWPPSLWQFLCWKKVLTHTHARTKKMGMKENCNGQWLQTKKNPFLFFPHKKDKLHSRDMFYRPCVRHSVQRNLHITITQ